MNPEHPPLLGDYYNRYYHALKEKGKLPYQIKQRREQERLIKLWEGQQEDAEEPDLLKTLKELVTRKQAYGGGYWKSVLEATYGEDVVKEDLSVLDHCIFAVYCSLRNDPAQKIKAKKILNLLSPTP